MEISPNNYKHLQVFLHWDRKYDCTSDNEFLMVTPNSFGKILVLDLTVEDNNVVFQIFDYKSKEVGTIPININDEKPSALFLSWKDVRKMVLDENTTIVNDDKLLEFDF